MGGGFPQTRGGAGGGPPSPQCTRRHRGPEHRGLARGQSCPLPAGRGPGTLGQSLCSWPVLHPSPHQPSLPQARAQARPEGSGVPGATGTSAPGGWAGRGEGADAQGGGAALEGGTARPAGPQATAPAPLQGHGTAPSTTPSPCRWKRRLSKHQKPRCRCPWAPRGPDPWGHLPTSPPALAALLRRDARLALAWPPEPQPGVAPPCCSLPRPVLGCAPHACPSRAPPVPTGDPESRAQACSVGTAPPGQPQPGGRALTLPGGGSRLPRGGRGGGSPGPLRTVSFTQLPARGGAGRGTAHVFREAGPPGSNQVA